MSVSLDCRGLACPEPVIRTRDALKDSPDSIEVCVDNVPATENVSRFLGRSGYVAEIKKTGDAAAKPASTAPRPRKSLPKPEMRVPEKRWCCSLPTS